MLDTLNRAEQLFPDANRDLHEFAKSVSPFASSTQDAVLAGIDAALEAGLDPIKLNSVIMGGYNEEDIESLVEYCARHADRMVLRFIEYMPFGQRRYRSVPAVRIRERLAERHRLRPLGRQRALGPARYWELEDLGVRVGFIAPLSEHFCETCNRLRLEADGVLRPCLARRGGASLRDLLRGGASRRAMERAIIQLVDSKPAGHACGLDGGTIFEGVMAQVGG